MEARCPVKMTYYENAPKCGRPLHNAPDGVDSDSVCLMHSKDTGKQSGELFEAFWYEFEAILKEAGGGEANFRCFVFPKANLRDKIFQAACTFEKVIFTQDAFFVNATFVQEASFFGATFEQDAGFWETTFAQRAGFSCVEFMKAADFLEANFKGTASFSSAKFTKHAGFGNTTFNRYAFFDGATFMQIAVLGSAAFEGSTSFSRAIFMENADFGDSIFTGSVDFTNARFLGTAKWIRSQFLEKTEFRHTVFDPQIAGAPSAIFATASFFKSGGIIFDDVDLSRALFHDSDVSGVWFTSSVRWGSWGRDHRAAVFEEVISLDQEHAQGLQRDGKRDYRAIAQVYQQLKKSYDVRLDYWTANEFHFGEMEMRRLAAPTKGRLLRLRRWLPRQLSLSAWYRYASDYGNSYVKPMLWLPVVLLVFGGLFPLPGAGLRRSNAQSKETYASAWQAGNSRSQRLWQEVRLSGKGFLTAVDTATFQKSTEYAPAYPWGRVLAVIETMFTSSLFALFLLAIRRQFRR
jgi:uncharacterized protein YjbI with pentapeptide repeats